MKWSRPITVHYPTVWSELKGKRALSDGRVPNFVIEDATEAMFEEVAHLIGGNFLQEVTESPEQSSPPSLEAQREVLDQKLTVVALEVTEDGTRKLVGVNVSVVQQQGEGVQGFASGSFDEFLNYVWQQTDIFSRFRVDQFLMGKGIYVLPQYRGQGIGLELLKARASLCRAVGLKATGAIFLSALSQRKLAQRGGYELLFEIKYADYKENGKSVLPTIKEQTCQVLGLKIQ